MRVIVHIGMDKTGTTSVKEYFKENREALLKEGILCPLSIGHLGRNAEYKTKNPAGLKKIFATELAQIPGDGTVYIGNENYFGLGDTQKEIMIEFLKIFNLDIILLCYLRPQVSHLVSNYQQYIKESFRRNHSTTHTNAIEHFHALQKRGYYKYSRMLDRWGKYIAKESMYIRAYHKDHLIDGCTVKDAASVVGFEIADAEYIYERPAWSAERLCFLKTLMECMNKSSVDIPKESRIEISRILRRENSGYPLELSRAFKSYIEQSCRDDNRRLVEKYLEPGHADPFLRQDTNSVNGKLWKDVDMDEIAGMYHRVKDDIPVLESFEPLFIDCLNYTKYSG